MSLRKAIASGKEHRQEYYGRAQQVDRTCRPHGGGSHRRPRRYPCPYCYSNRMHNTQVKELAATQQLVEEIK